MGAILLLMYIAENEKVVKWDPFVPLSHRCVPLSYHFHTPCLLPFIASVPRLVPNTRTLVPFCALGPHPLLDPTSKQLGQQDMVIAGQNRSVVGWGHCTVVEGPKQPHNLHHDQHRHAEHQLMAARAQVPLPRWRDA